MTRRWAGAVVGLAASVLVGTSGMARAEIGARPTDKQVKALIEALDQARDRFEDQLDGQLKNATLRGPRGEVKVREYLDDYQEDVKNLRERFSDSYAASQEAAVVLGKGTAIYRFLEGYDRQIKGRSEFERLASELSRLAGAYGVTFPLEQAASPRRYNDAEVAKIAGDLGHQADLLKKAVDRDKSIPKGDKQAVKGDLDRFKKLAGTVKSQTSDHDPASAEVRQMVDLGARIGQFVGTHQSTAAGPSWGAMRSGLDTLARAFGGI